jgi:hypothetical protein
VAPLRLGGLRGKQSNPSVSLGGTGEISTVGEWERQGEWTQHGARDVARSVGRRPRKAKGNGMILIGIMHFSFGNLMLLMLKL